MGAFLPLASPVNAITIASSMQIDQCDHHCFVIAIIIASSMPSSLLGQCKLINGITIGLSMPFHCFVNVGEAGGRNIHKRAKSHPARRRPYITP